MDSNIQELLEKTISENLEDLTNYGLGSPERSMALNNLQKIHNMRVEETRMLVEIEEKSQKRELENKEFDLKEMSESHYKCYQFEANRKDTYIRMGIEVAGIVLPMIFYAVWMNKGFKFEETGTYTSTTFKGLFNRFKPTKH